MSVKHVQFALDGVPGLNAGQRLTLVSLGEWANDDGLCWPSHDTIGKRVGVGRRQVIRILEQLEEMGVVERIERKQHSNTYRIRCDRAVSHLGGPKTPADVTPTAHVAPASDVTSGTPDVTSRTADVTSRASRCDIAMSPEPLEPPVEPPREPLERERARGRPVPAEFAVSEEQYRWALTEHNLGRRQVDSETVKFLDHHRAKGTTFRDWPAAWRNWMRRCVQYGATANGRVSPAGLQNTADQLARMRAQREGRADEEIETRFEVVR